MINLKELAGKINIAGPLRLDEPLKEHTSYKVGGRADLFVEPETVADVITLHEAAETHHLPVFILGAGANILVSDRGIRGMVLSTERLRAVRVDGERIVAEAGCAISLVSEAAAAVGLAGLAFIYAMPGSVGGAVWMNARCYGSSISDVLDWVEILDEAGTVVRVDARPDQFDYKISPFQKRRAVILSACFRLRRDERAGILEEMESNRADRERKGHFAAPSAGSVFKNNRGFGNPSGKIIDSLGLRGYSIGGAKISEHHANMIINTGSATASDIEDLTRYVARRVREELGFELEREVIPVGEW